MNWIPPVILLLYLILSTVGNTENMIKRRGRHINSGLWKMDFYTVDSTNTAKESHMEHDPESDKQIKYVTMKMLLIATNKNNCVCNSSDYVDISTTEENQIFDTKIKLSKRDKLETQNSEANIALKKMCPYFMPNEGFRMDKMADVFWAKFHSMKENLNCFKIVVQKLSEMQKKRKEIVYGTFDGRVDWSRVYFEIDPPDSLSEIRHYLLGDANEMGVMRNILIKADDTGEFALHEESPDQWLMLGKLLLLRDCASGEVILFTRAPQMTTTNDIVLALQHLGENMIGKMMCEEDGEPLD